MSKLTDRIETYDADHPEGRGTSLHMQRAIHNIAVAAGARTIVEIGVSRGAMTSWLAAAIEQQGGGELYAVDDWSCHHGGKAHGPGPMLARMEDLGLSHLVRPVSSDSVAFLRTLDDQSVDMVWVDGDHSYAGALRDAEEGWGVTRDILGVHDTDHCEVGEDVSAAIATLMSSIEDELATSRWLTFERGAWIGRKLQ